MQCAAIIEHLNDQDKIKAVGPAHRTYLRGLLESGRLCAAGPLSDEAGALWVYEADTAVEAEQMIKDDPSTAAGVFVKWQLYPLAYWSATAYKAGIKQ